MQLILTIPDELTLQTWSNHIAPILKAPFTIYLIGDLGAGKTTLVRHVLRGLGCAEKIKSPTYTLIESYLSNHINIHHFDLYRLSDPSELEFIGIREYFNANSLCFIEWPDKGRGFLAPPDLQISIEVDTRENRILTITHASQAGKEVLYSIQNMAEHFGL